MAPVCSGPGSCSGSQPYCLLIFLLQQHYMPINSSRSYTRTWSHCWGDTVISRFKLVFGDSEACKWISSVRLRIIDENRHCASPSRSCFESQFWGQNSRFAFRSRDWTTVLFAEAERPYCNYKETKRPPNTNQGCAINSKHLHQTSASRRPRQQAERRRAGVMLYRRSALQLKRLWKHQTAHSVSNFQIFFLLTHTTFFSPSLISLAVALLLQYAWLTSVT